MAKRRPPPEEAQLAVPRDLEPAPDWIEELLAREASYVEEESRMFRKSAPVFIAIAGGTVPGRCVEDPQPDTYVNRRGAVVRTERVPVISLRTVAGRPSWYQLSYESATLLSPRDEAVTGLDADKEGQPIPLSALWARQRESLQAYLGRQQAQRQAVAVHEDRAGLVPGA